MNDCWEILQRYPVRKSKQQKKAFRAELAEYVSRFGYSMTEEKGSCGSVNLLFGDPKTADYLVTAHYDTCARLPFPNFLTPCNLGIYLLYQLAVVAAFLVLLGVLNVLLTPLMTPVGAYWFSLLVWLGLVLMMLIGPANPSCANDNTSGVISVLEIMQALPEEQRGKVCFVLFDLEEAGLIGSHSYRKCHKAESGEQLVLNLDCVGDGDHFLLIPSQKLVEKRTNRVLRWQPLYEEQEGKTLKVVTEGFRTYPSDQANFPLGVGIAAFRKGKHIGLYLSRIHTPKDTICERNNVLLIRDYLLKLIREQA